MIAGVQLDTAALLDLRHLAARRRSTRMTPQPGAMAGDMIQRRRGRGLEVHDVRPWVDGDDIRHLDQHATARTSVPHTRSFLDERERSLLLVADMRPSMLFGTRRAFRSVAGAEALVLLGWQTAARGGRVGLVTLSGRGNRYVRQGRGDRAMIAIVGALVEAHRDALAARATPEPKLDEALEAATVLSGSGAAIVFATGLDTPGPRLDEVLLGIRQRRKLACLLVEDAFERDPPPGEYPFRTVDGRGGWLRIGARRPPSRDRPAELRRLGIQTMRLLSSEAPERSLLSLEKLDV